MFRAIQLGDLEQTNSFDLKACIFTYPFERASGVAGFRWYFLDM